MKDKKETPPIDYESLYYKVMQENVLLTNKKVSIDFTDSEIGFLRSTMYEELMEMKFDLTDYDDEDEKEENKKLGKAKNDEFLKALVDEKKQLVERIIKKLRFEIR
jgi:hypothetical protein